MEAHEALCLLKDVAIQLGKTPSRREFFVYSQGRLSEHMMTKLFGTFSAMLQAAGLDPVRPKKIDKHIFDVSIENHLSQYKEDEHLNKIELIEYKKTLFIPDTHFPFGHKKTLQFIYDFAKEHQPEIIVQVGDLYDMYSHTKFPRSHNVFMPKEEQQLARAQAEEMWRLLKDICADAKCYQLLGNHDVRPLKRVLEAYPEAEDWIKRMVGEMMSFENVETVLDPRDELMLPGDVMVIHGYKSKLGEHRDHALYSAVCGHQHVGGVVYRQLRGRTLWELNCGLAGDPEAKGLSYTPQKLTRWTLGFGWLDKYGPRFIPLR